MLLIIPICLLSNCWWDYGSFIFIQKKSYKSKEEDHLTNDEIDQLVEDWKPEPLVPSVKKEDLALSELRIVESSVGAHVIVDGKECINTGCSGFFDLQKNQELIDYAIECTNTYGVGSCGPRGFYGSIQPHLDLEEKIAQFMGVEEALIFSASFQTIASVIPAFSSVGDILIIDKGVNIAIQNGAYLSRAEILWFNHNDMEELHRILSSLASTFKKYKKRVFVVVEGLYVNYGDMVPLPEIMEFKKKQYPFRIILDECLSVGVLGKTGRGVTEHFEIPAQDIELICGSLSNTFGGTGGFAVGPKLLCNHMRLNCTGYVFSASLPPYISSSIIHAIDIVKEGSELLKLRNNIEYFRQKLIDNDYLTTTSDILSPLIHLRLKESRGNNKTDQKFLSELVDKVYHKYHVILCHTRYLEGKEKFIPPPSLKIHISSKHTFEDLDIIVSSLRMLE